MIALLEDGEVKLVVDQIIEGVFESARQNLVAKREGNQFGLCIRVIFVSSRRLSTSLYVLPP